MNREIDLRALIVGNLNCKRHDIEPCTLVLGDNVNLIDRMIECSKVWTRIEQTSYIESIFLRCGLQPIIRFQGFNHTVIVDGYNRYLSIKNFCENKLVLDIRGLKQLKFLADKNFNGLTPEERSYFESCDPITVLDYTYDNKNTNKILSEDEEYEIVRYLHLIYNTGIRLEIEEIQKAQFYDDYITSKIREKLTNDENSNYSFINMLEALGMFNGRKKRNKVDNILLNCRLLIASTYSNMNDFCSTYNIETRIEENYLPNLKDVDLNTVYNDFTLNVRDIYNNLVSTQKWNAYPILHVKPFLEATYWLISVIRKDNLGEPLRFDFMKYLDYFGSIEESEKNFNPYQAHYKKNIYNKYWVVAKYYEEKYAVDMSRYFKQQNIKKENIFLINNIEELSRNHFNFKPVEVTVSNMLNNLKNRKYNLRPYYQRTEVMNPSVSSKIIESILLGIQIPYILACDIYSKDSVVTEIIDGQQRLLSILPFLKKPFMNENGELEYSNKNGYALKDLRILYELNNYKVGEYGEKNSITNDYKNKILNYTLYIYKSAETNRDNFSAVDHFVRLNKNNYTIKDNTYRMWSLICDKKIIEYEKEVTSKYVSSILPPVNPKRTADMVTFKLACLFYHKDFNDINLNNYSNRRVSFWLKDFNEKKDKYMFKDIEKIEQIRKGYICALDDVKCFYDKLAAFLESSGKTIRDLVAINGSVSIPLSNYYYLFCMLGNFPKGELFSNGEKIYEIIKAFFDKIKFEKFNNEQIIELLKFTVKEISIFDSTRRYQIYDKQKSEFRDKLNIALNR